MLLHLRLHLLRFMCLTILLLPLLSLVALVPLARERDARSVIHLVRPPTALHVLNRADTALVALVRAVNFNTPKDAYFLTLSIVAYRLPRLW